MKNFSRIILGIVSGAVIFGSLLAIANRQDILDALALRGYTPNQRVVSLADATTMNDNTRRVFYVNHPELNDKESFRQNCSAAEQSIVLGCFVERKGIFLLDVTDERLNGVIEVTAAHEVLHAQYDRLSSGERKRVDDMTNKFFATVTDERIKKTIEQYRAKDPSVVPNELHSILATEIRSLSPELEAYYGKYFKDRSKVVDFSEKYEQTFVDLTDQVENFDEQLKTMKQTIETGQKQIDEQNAQIETQKANLDALLNSGRTEEYNAAVPAFNAQVSSYNRLVNSTRGTIDEYNQIVEKRNAIATAEQELIEAIDSNVEPKKTQ